MIRKMTLTFSLLLAFFMAGFSQQFAIVDITKVLESLDEYKVAQTQLDEIAQTWRQEIAQEYDKIKSLYNKYQAEQVLLSEEVRKQREEEIMIKEKEAQELNRAKFGPEGALFRKRQELINPVQDKVYEAIEEYALGRGIDIVLDKSSTAGLIYSNDKFDRTADIMNKLGH